MVIEMATKAMSMATAGDSGMRAGDTFMFKIGGRLERCQGQHVFAFEVVPTSPEEPPFSEILTSSWNFGIHD